MLDLTHRPPVARRDETDSADPYAWLRAKEAQETLDHLNAENAYADQLMQPASARREHLYKEMRGRIKETDQSVPVKLDDWVYYSRTEQDQQYSIHCRKRMTPDAQEEILLDENLLASGQDYFRLGAFAVSPDHRLLAYAFDLDGGETYAVRVRDLTTQALLPDVIDDVSNSIEWGNDNQTLFYNTLDETHRPFRVWRHRLGATQADDVMLFEEPDERFFVNIYKTKSRQFLGIHLGSHTTDEVYLLDANQPQGEFWLFSARDQGVEYTVEHSRDRFYILTNHDAVNFRLLVAPVADPRRENWTELIPHDPAVMLDGIDTFRDYVALLRRADGLRGIRVYQIDDWTSHDIEFEEAVYTASTAANPEFVTTELRFIYSSLVTPSSVYDYDMDSRTRELKKQMEVRGGYQPDDYACERLHATSPDGTQVPISLVYRKDCRADGPAPTLLYGYGSYGICVDPTFDSTRVSLLDRGFVWAIAHVRGGGDLGRPWYNDGKLRHKRNTFEDFIACAEHLIETKRTAPGRLAIRGGSAGGLLVGAVSNMRPDLFKVVVAKVPFVDVVNTMSDPSLPLTVIEYEEWGRPDDPDDRDYILSYSPYDNVRPQNYPDFLITAGLNDPRVGFWEPAKWAARLRELRTDNGLLLLKTEMGAGHSGPSGRYKFLEELAMEYAFILERLDVGERDHASNEATEASPQRVP